MNVRTVRIFGGPLDGGVYDIVDQPGKLIELNCAAGVFVYQLQAAEADEIVLKYVRPGPRDGGKRKDKAA